MTRGSRRPHGGRSRQAAAPDGSARLTARGAIAVLFVLSVAGLLIGQTFDASWAGGVVFVIGCLVVSLWVRPSDMLGVAVAPPLVYLVALIAVKAVGGLSAGNFWQSTGLSTLLNLSAVLFWLLGGTVLTVLVLLIRGLPRTVGDLRAELRGEHDEPADPLTSRPPVAPRAAPPRPAPPPPGPRRGGPNGRYPRYR